MKTVRILTALFVTIFITGYTLNSWTQELPSEIDLYNAEEFGVLSILGEEESDVQGLKLASGDINGDGFDDVIMGGRDIPSGGFPACPGKVFVVFGSSDINSINELDLQYSHSGVLKIVGAGPDDFLGSDVTAGDINGDGVDDLIASAWGADPLERSNAGEVYFFLGSTELESQGIIELNSYDFVKKDIIRIIGENEGDKIGFSISTGDINGDGYDDVIIGGYLSDPDGRDDAGKTYIIFGSENIFSKNEIDLAGSHDEVVEVWGDGYGDISGYEVTTGNVNGDEYDDLLISARFADPNEKSNAGETYLIFGSDTFPLIDVIDLRNPSVGVIRINGANSDDYSGNWLGSGDIDQDGYDDIIIDAHGFDPDSGLRNNAGGQFIIFGSPDLSSSGEINLDDQSKDIVRIFGKKSEDLLGPVEIGDINGDGIGDIVSGSIGADPFDRRGAGEGYIVFGSLDFQSRNDIDLFNPPSYVVNILGGYGGTCTAARVAVGDINGDGYDDAILSAHGASPLGRRCAGTAYVVWGAEKNILYLASPDGGELWETETVHDIIWQSFGEVGQISIEYSADGGITWMTIIDNIDASVGRYAWTTPDTESTMCLIKITDVSDSDITCTSSSVFTVSPPFVRVTFPNGGEIWGIDKTYSINWISLGIENICIEYSIDNGENWEIIAESFEASSGSCQWKTPEIESSECLVRISDILNSECIDVTDNVFILSQQLLTLLSPYGMEHWYAGEEKVITWDSYGVESIKIEFSVDGGLTWNIIAENVDALEGSYLWFTPYLQSALCLIKISDTENDKPVDLSDVTFEISSPQSVGESILKEFMVFQNSPNPFNPTTSITFNLPEPGKVIINIFNINGQLVDHLANEFFDAGRHTVYWDGSGFSAGVYLCNVKFGDFSKTMKMMFVK